MFALDWDNGDLTRLVLVFFCYYIFRDGKRSHNIIALFIASEVDLSNSFSRVRSKDAVCRNSILYEIASRVIHGDTLKRFKLAERLRIGVL